MVDLIKKYFHNTDENINEFNPPATNDQIIELEKQLGIHLPKDYKDFLLFTNGFEG